MLELLIFETIDCSHPLIDEVILTFVSHLTSPYQQIILEKCEKNTTVFSVLILWTTSSLKKLLKMKLICGMLIRQKCAILLCIISTNSSEWRYLKKYTANTDVNFHAHSRIWMYSSSQDVSYIKSKYGEPSVEQFCVFQYQNM